MYNCSRRCGAVRLILICLFFLVRCLPSHTHLVGPLILPGCLLEMAPAQPVQLCQGCFVLTLLPRPLFTPPTSNTQFFYFANFETESVMEPRLAWNSPTSCPNLSAEIIGMHTTPSPTPGSDHQSWSSIVSPVNHSFLPQKGL